MAKKITFIDRDHNGFLIAYADGKQVAVSLSRRGLNKLLVQRGYEKV